MERGQCAVLVAPYRVHHAVLGAGRGSVCVLDGIRMPMMDMLPKGREDPQGALEMCLTSPSAPRTLSPVRPATSPIEVAMFPAPKPTLTPNTYAYESEPMVKATGFREYDARWLFDKEINLMGVQALGHGARHADRANSASSRRSSPATISAATRPRSNMR